MAKFNLEIDGKFKSTTEGNDIWWYGGGGVAWGSLANAKAGVPLAIRSGKTVGVLENGKVVEYIWQPDDLTDNGLIAKGGGNIPFIEDLSGRSKLVIILSTITGIFDAVMDE